MIASDTKHAIMAIRSVMILLTELVHTTFSDFNKSVRPQQCPFLDFNNSNKNKTTPPPPEHKRARTRKLYFTRIVVLIQSKTCLTTSPC